MSNNMNNFTPFPGAWRTGVMRPYDAHTLNNNRDTNEVPVPVYFRSHSRQANDDRDSDVLDPRGWLADRTPTGFHGIPNFPAQPQSRQQNYAHNGNMGRGLNPRFREIFSQSPPRFPFQTSTRFPLAEERSKSTALSNLKKVIYNPSPKKEINNPTPKLLAMNLSSYYREKYNAVNGLKERKKEKDEDGKSCAVCLEDFKPGEEVMSTPCHHMFHEDCIVPWLTSKTQCPVCRSVIIERVGGNPASFNNNDNANLEPSDMVDGELLSILRTMEEAFHLNIH